LASDLKQRLQKDLDRARKAREKLTTLVLSSTLSELRNWEIENGREAGDEDVRQVLSRARKQRNEAADQMRQGGRSELAEREEQEAAILQEYLPPPLTEDEVRILVRAAIGEGAGDVGPVMGRIMSQIQGRFDGKEANRIVREELAR